MFKTLEWKGIGFNIKGKYISHLQFTYIIIIIIMAETL